MLLELINICLVGRYKTYILYIVVPSRKYSDVCGTSCDGVTLVRWRCRAQRNSLLVRQLASVGIAAGYCGGVVDENCSGSVSDDEILFDPFALGDGFAGDLVDDRAVVDRITPLGKLLNH